MHFGYDYALSTNSVSMEIRFPKNELKLSFVLLQTRTLGKYQNYLTENGGRKTVSFGWQKNSNWIQIIGFTRRLENIFKNIRNFLS